MEENPEESRHGITSFTEVSHEKPGRHLRLGVGRFPGKEVPFLGFLYFIAYRDRREEGDPNVAFGDTFQLRRRVH